MDDVYLLEDDGSICELVTCALELSGIKCRCFNTAADFRDALAERLPRLAVLDVMLPDGNGFEILEELKRRTPELPCIMLSAMSRETDKVKGLNLGADDYIAKPFGVMEFSARIAAALRRGKSVNNILKAGALELDRAAMTAALDGKPLPLNSKEWKLLLCLAENEGRVLSRDRLLDIVWGYEVFAETRTVDNHIARLRKAGLEKNIITVFGSGYKFTANGEKDK